MKHAAAILLVFLASVVSAQAQTVKESVDAAARDYLLSHTGTIATESKPQFADGKLFGCMIQFTALVQDLVNRQGELIKMSGLFGIMSPENRTAVVLQLSGNDIEPITLKEKPFVPASAYFISGANSSKPYLIAKKPPGSSGNLFVIFKMDGAHRMILDALTKEKITIAFNRETGGVDQLIPIDLTIEATSESGAKKRSKKSINKFLDCSTELLKSQN